MEETPDGLCCVRSPTVAHAQAIANGDTPGQAGRHVTLFSRAGDGKRRMTSGVVLDASALLAMIREEPGGESVAGVVARARMSAVNSLEVVSYLTYAGVPPGQIEDMLTPLPVVVIDAGRRIARQSTYHRR